MISVFDDNYIYYSHSKPSGYYDAIILNEQEEIRIDINKSYFDTVILQMTIHKIENFKLKKITIYGLSFLDSIKFTMPYMVKDKLEFNINGIEIPEERIELIYTLLT